MADNAGNIAAVATNRLIPATDALSTERTAAIRESLKNALNAELAKEGNINGLQPGDVAAISSSVGQSISF